MNCLSNEKGRHECLGFHTHFPCPVTKPLEKADSRATGKWRQEKTEAERSEIGAFESHSTSMHPDSPCGFMTTTDTVVIGFICRFW